MSDQQGRFDKRTGVLFVGINYAPEHSGIGPYTTAAAEHLAARGDRVRVLTGLPHYPQWNTPREARRSVRRVSNGVEVDRLRHFVPARQDASRRGLYELSFAAQVAMRSAVRPEAVVAVVPSLLSGLVASHIARRVGCPLIVWIQDSMGAAASQSGMSGGRRVAGAVNALERHLYTRAESLLVVSDAFRSHLARVGADPSAVVTVPNWSHVHAVPAGWDRTVVRRRHGWGDHETVVLHTGNMGLKQDLGKVVDTARLAAPGGRPVRFVLMGDGSQRSELERLARGVESVSIVDPVPEHEYAQVLRSADILLINERPGVLDMSLPSKLTSYFTAGLPVLASVHADGGTASEIRRSGGGVVTASQSAEDLLAGVVQIAADDGAMAARLGRRAQEHVERHLSSGSSLEILTDVIDRLRRPVGDRLPV